MLQAVKALQDCSVREEEGRQHSFAPEKQHGLGTNNFSVPSSQEMQRSWDTDPTSQPAQPVQLIFSDVVITTPNSSRSREHAAPHLCRAEIKLQRDCLTQDHMESLQQSKDSEPGHPRFQLVTSSLSQPFPKSGIILQSQAGWRKRGVVGKRGGEKLG